MCSATKSNIISADGPRHAAPSPQNAVIISAPHASFIERWRASYETFDEGEWAQHSVEEPWVGAGLPCNISGGPLLADTHAPAGHREALSNRSAGARLARLLLAHVARERGGKGTRDGRVGFRRERAVWVGWTWSRESRFGRY